MSKQSEFVLHKRNPDVLNCIANLSNDEIFTPPELANRMLDTIAEAWTMDHGGANLWAEPTVKFLDPCTKSGVFLREITTRLTKGLADQIPDLQKRVDHILTTQVFGIGITRLTSMLARRSLYCSKHANGAHSIVNSFTNETGNVWFNQLEHNWTGNKCRYCSAQKKNFDRDDELETHAYAFIHTDEIETSISEIFGRPMQFDVIIGNPPYQMAGGSGGSSDSSIYHKFVQQAINLEPRYVCMVVPSRWMAGGRGLDDFRTIMLKGDKLKTLIDFPDSSEAFPGVQIKGGVCYFLWDGSHNGTCELTRITGGVENIQKNRELGEYDVLVRDERAIRILKKVLSKNELSILDLVSSDTPFGLATNFKDWHKKGGPDQIVLHLINRGKRTKGFIDRRQIKKYVKAIDVWKVLVPKAYGAGESFPHQILGKEIIAAPPSVCTQSFLTVSPFEAESAATSFASYYHTRFFRFLVSLRKITQDALRSTYSWVPMQSWDRVWTDEMLFEKYGISDDEVEYLISRIRPMDEPDE